MRENQYQSDLIGLIEEMFPDCIVQKQDPNYRQGMPDLLILYMDRWAMLEVKTSANATEQPNQRHYVNQCDAMSFAAFIYPENEEQTLIDLRYHFYGR